MRETAATLASFAGRGACTDSERRATAALRDLARARGRDARVTPVWVRPQWAALHALHAALAAGATLLSTWEPEAGLAVLSVVLFSTLADLSGRALPSLRLLWPRRATQVLVSDAPDPNAPVRLLLAAHVDAGTTGLAYRRPWVGAEARLRRALHGHLSSPLAFLAFCIALLTLLAAARVALGEESWMGPAALGPTAVCILAFGVLVDIALSPVSPGANANASGVAVALAVADALDRRPPRRLAVELVLSGAGEAGQLGMRAHVRAARRRGVRPEEVVVLAFGPCGGGRPRVFLTEGLLAPLRLHPRLTAIGRSVIADESHLAAGTARRGLTAAWPARLARWPALSIGCLDAAGRPPRARTPGDTADALDDRALEDALELALGIVARLDADLA